MVQQLMQQLLGAMGKGQTETQEQQNTIDNWEHLYSLLCFVQKELVRYEQIFNMAEEEALIDNSIYMLKSLRAQQQFLVQNLRRLEGVGKQAEAVCEAKAETISTDAVTKEGFAMG